MSKAETKSCIACAEDIKPDAILCKHCKTRQDEPTFQRSAPMAPKQDAVKAKTSTAKSINSSSNQSSFTNVKPGAVFAVIAAAVVVVFVAILGTSNNGQSSGNPYEGYPELREKFEAIPISATDCDSVSLLIDFEPFALEASEKLETAEEASLASTEFTAKDYLEENPWMRNARLPESEKPYGQFIRQLSDPILDKTILELDIDSQEEFNENSVEAWYNTFSNHVLETCGLSEKFQEKKEIVTSFETAITSVINKAAREPWYPEGFQEVAGFPGFAFQTSDRACTFSFGGSCAVFYIVSKTDCSSNLYVQTNLLNGGVVVDWSNDTATVRAGQVALMETTFTSSSGGNWEFAEISCY